jgi:propionate CoA-transferase
MEKTSKLISVDEAVGLIKDGSTIAVGGFVGCGNPEEITSAIEKNYIAKKKPSDLTIMYNAGQGDSRDRGINHFAHEGLVKRVIGGHWGLVPKMVKLVVENKIEAYNFPQGVISHMFRDIAAKRPGTISTVGLKTFVDPRISGGKMNDLTGEDIIELINLNGREYLFYKPVNLDVALLRGTTADVDGNISMEKEAVSLEALAIAQATRNCGGIVFAQVERIAAAQTLNPWMVQIPGILVDYIVVSQPENHWQTFAEKYNPSFSGEVKVPVDFIPVMSLDERKVICRRALKEIKENAVVNLGIGLPEGISFVANEEKELDKFKLTVEAGTIGGIPAGGLSFGATYNPECIVDQPAQFDFYDGGGIDIAFLGMAEADRAGNVNVSRFADRIAGCGGFINISQNTKNVVFCGTFTSGGLEVDISYGKISIIKEGRFKKFKEKVNQITFSGEYANEVGQEILYITERGVFKLTSGGMMLAEIAPGIELETDIIKSMEFRPSISKDLKIMDSEIFID